MDSEYRRKGGDVTRGLVIGLGAFMFMCLFCGWCSCDSSSLTSSPSIDVNQILEQTYVESLSSSQKKIYMSLPLVVKTIWFGQWRRNNSAAVEKAMGRAANNIASQASVIATQVSKEVTSNTAANVAAQIIQDQAGKLNDVDKKILYTIKDAAVAAAADAAANSIGQPLNVVMANVATALESKLQLSKATPAQQQVLGHLKNSLVQSISQIPVAMTPQQSAMIAANALSAPITMTNYDGSAVITINPIVQITPKNAVIVDMTATRAQATAKLLDAINLSIKSGKISKAEVGKALASDNMKIAIVMNDFVSGKLANLKAAAIGINLTTV